MRKHNPVTQDEMVTAMEQARSTYRVHAVREIRKLTGWDLRQTLIFIADAFGFRSVGLDKLSDGSPAASLNGWRAFIKWHDAHPDFNFEAVEGPHAIAIFKAIVARHRPKRASTGRSI